MFSFEGKIYWSEKDVMEAIMEAHPELGDDALVEYSESHVEELMYAPGELEYRE